MLRTKIDLLDFAFSTGSRKTILDTYRGLVYEDSRVSELVNYSTLRSNLIKKYSENIKFGRLEMEYLEMDVAYACNLHCKGCSHYSDYTFKGYVDFEIGSEWLRAWSEKLNPKFFKILGGEPTLNPRLEDYVRLIHQIWPNAGRAATSNGLLPKRQPDSFFRSLAETNTYLDISVHGDDPDFLRELDQEWIKVQASKFNFNLGFNSALPENFTKLYRGKGPTMMPYEDKNPQASWIRCSEKNCPTIHNGRLYACPPIAFLDLIDAKFNLSSKPIWLKYISHKGLLPTVPLEQIVNYLCTAADFCSMCPAYDSKHYTE